jgi:hypothetical protein
VPSGLLALSGTGRRAASARMVSWRFSHRATSRLPHNRGNLRLRFTPAFATLSTKQVLPG